MKYVKIATLVCMLAITAYRCFFFSWNSRPEQWDERTNIEVLQESTILTLRHNNEPFFEKPPLWYIISLTLNSLVNIRLFSATCGFLMILLVFFATSKWWGFSAGLMSWLVLITTNQLFQTNPDSIFSTHTMHSADSDILFVLLLCISFFTGVSENKNILIAGISTGLALLTKNPLGIIPLVWITVFHRKNTYMRQAWLSAGVLYISWIVYSYINFGSTFIQQYFGYHIITRTIQGIEGHTHSTLYFFQILFNKQLFIFFEIYLVALFFIIKLRIKDSRLRVAAMISLSLLCIPTLMQTKLSWYILPFYPFAAITMAGGLALFVGNITRISSGDRVKSAPGKQSFKKAKSGKK